MALPKPPSPGGGGGGGGGGSSSGGSSGGRSSSSSSGSSGGSSGGSSRSSGGGGPSYVPGVKYFGQPITRAQYGQLKQRYNDLFRAWLGRPVRTKELNQIINRGVSDYSLRLQLAQKKGFTKSPMYKTLTQQASDVLGFTYKPPRKAIVQALRSEGGLSADSFRAALANNMKVQNAVLRDFNQTQGADVEYALGAFGNTGEFNQQQRRALALQSSGLKQTTLGRRLESSFQTALQRAQRAFQGTLATSQQSPMSQNQTQARQEDLPA